MYSIMRIRLILAIFLLCNFIIAQENKSSGTLKGIVLDEKMRPISFSNIWLIGTSFNTKSDVKGKFIIENIPAGHYLLVINTMGYETQSDSILITDGSQMDAGNLILLQKSITLKEVVVSPGSFAVMGTNDLAKLTLSEKDLKNMSWSEDITRAVARLPGVASNDFSSKFTIRGGEADEVLMIVDGMELYDPFHQRDISGGLFSIVDVETIQGIDLLTGGFTAEYGNRQSGVFNMKTKQIGDGERSTSLGLSMMNAKAYTDGTFAKNRGSYLFSARRGMSDLIFKIIGPSESIPFYTDAMGKVEYKLNEKHTLSFHTLRADDKTYRSDLYLTNYDSSDIKYSNTYSWLTLKSFYNPDLFSRTILFTGFNNEDRNGSYAKDEYGDVGTFLLTDKRSFSFVGIKQDWTWNISERFIFKSGFDLRRLKAAYDYFYSLDDIRPNTQGNLFNSLIVVDVESSPTSNQAGTYISGRIQITPTLFMETGLRFDYASHTNDKLWSPRVSIAYAFSKKTFLRAAWGYYYQTQFINNLDVNHNASSFNPAELSKHYVVGLEHLFANHISLRLEAYFKDMPRINPIYQNLRDPIEVFPEARNDVIKLNINSTTSRGIELFAKYDMNKKISWWFSYAIAKGEDDIQSIEFDGLFTARIGKIPRNTNQTHTLYADFNYRPASPWHFSLSWQLYTGWHRTNYHYNTTVMADGRLIFYPVHELYNATAYPAYHRLDIRVNRYFQLKKSRISAYLHIINVYNQKNLRKFDIGATDQNENLIPDGNGGYLTPRGDKYWFGTTPVLGFSWEF